MVKSRFELLALKHGDNLAVALPLVDRGHGASQNVCVKGGILK